MKLQALLLKAKVFTVTPKVEGGKVTEFTIEPKDKSFEGEVYTAHGHVMLPKEKT